VSVAGRNAIVTGAATGMGAATVAAIEADGGEALALDADVSDPAAIEGVAACTQEAFGGADILELRELTADVDEVVGPFPAFTHELAASVRAHLAEL
jgi:NAD(P)-dependent dehydrogenase (short-subunit alcohol dehydrogenase family)